MALGNLKEHLLTAVATSALLGGGTALLTNRIDIARHDERITRIEKLDGTMEKLTAELADTRMVLARVEAKQETQK